MPKRGGRQNFNNGNNGGGGGGSRFSSLKDYQDLDDPRDNRNKERNSTRRVSFKPSLLQPIGGIKRHNMKDRMTEMAIRSRLEDDELMDNFASSSKFEDRGYGNRRKGSPIPKGKFGNFRKLVPSTFGWYQVTVQMGQRYGKDDLIRALLNALSPDIFIPHYWRAEKNCIIFFVDDFNIAERLQQVDRSVQMSDGYRLFLRVRSGCPIVSVDQTFKERMKIVMAKRYNAQTRALDLTKFHADPEFKEMFCSLFRTPVMLAALEIIEKNIPDLEALNLNDNHITSMESFKDVSRRLPNLKILYLDDNKLPSLAHLMVLRNVPIVELVLKGNPLRQRYKDKSLYVSEVRRKFPKIMKLDGEILEPQILFDVQDSSSLPQAKASFLCDASGAEIARQFLEQYFIIFDSDNRQPLLDAYHEQAMMSITVPPASQAGRLTSFWKYNRNFRRFINNDDNSKIRNLKVGRLAVVSTFAEWPRTQHDPQSFSVDLSVFTPKLLSLTVAGLFKEFDSTSANSTSGEVRYFERQFVIVPAGAGFCIRNEMVLITNASNAQSRRFLKPPPPLTPQPSHTAAMSTVTSPGAPNTLNDRLRMNQPSTSAAAASLHVVDDNLKLQMIQALIAQSNMNMEWSEKCLAETNWDYHTAVFVFEKLHKENKIPPEAYIK